MIEVLRTRVLPVLAVVLLGAIAGAGIVPLLSLGNDEPPAEAAAPTTVPTTSAPSTVLVVPTPSTIEIPGLSASINVVLARDGFLTHQDRASLEAALAPSVVRVLEESNEVITVVDSSESP